LSRIGAPIGIVGARQGEKPADDDKCLPACGANRSRGRVRRKKTELGHLPFLIRRDGTWLYHGTPVNRKELVCLFSSVLEREADGTWWLNTPVERGRIEVEDAPFVAVELDWAGDGRHQTLSFRTNIDQVITAGPEHPIRVSHDLITCDPVPYIRVRPGAGHLAIEARISRAVYYELVALAVPEWVGCRHMLGVWSQGKFFPLGEASHDVDDLDDPLCDGTNLKEAFEDRFEGFGSDVASGEA